MASALVHAVMAARMRAAVKNRAFGPAPTAPGRLLVPGRTTGIEGVYTRPALRYNSDHPAPNSIKARPIPSVIPPRRAQRS